MARRVFTSKAVGTNGFAVCIGLTVGVVGKTIFDRLKGLDEPGAVNESDLSQEYQSKSELHDLEQKYGLPQPSPVLSYTNHVVGYDTAHKTPKWVVQRINRNMCEGKLDRTNCHFRKDQNIAEMFSATNEDYSKSGFSRGHMASAGDNRSDKKSVDDTFYLTNVVPQNFKNNSGFWLRLENYCRKLAKKYSDIYVVSGPLYLSHIDMVDKTKYIKYQVIGPREVAVPTHLYKVILVENNSTPVAIGVFIIPNEPISNSKGLRDFIFPLKYLEEKLGHEMFPKIEKSKIPLLCDIESCKLISKEEIELKSKKEKNNKS